VRHRILLLFLTLPVLIKQLPDNAEQHALQAIGYEARVEPPSKQTLHTILLQNTLDGIHVRGLHIRSLLGCLDNLQITNRQSAASRGPNLPGMLRIRHVWWISA
jgi:hypothetical protein